MDARIFTINYIKNGLDNAPLMLISEKTEHGWESVRFATGEVAEELLETLLYSEREDI